MTIPDILREFHERFNSKEKLYPVIGTAVNVDAVKKICGFEPLDGGGLRRGIRFNTEEDEPSGITLVPKEGSLIGVTFLNTETGFVSLFGKLEKVHFSAGDEDLKLILNDLIKELKNAVIQTPSGPGTVSEPTKVLLDAINIRINKLLY